MLLAALKNKFYKSFIAFWLPVAFAQAGQGTPFENVVCPDTKQLVKELLDSELSGQRFFAAKPECRDFHNFPHFRSSTYSYGEKPGTLGWFEADAQTPYVIKKISELPDKLIYVEFEWHVVDKKNSKKTKIISDVFKFALYAGKTKDVVGCAGVLFAPANIVVRQSCINVDKSKK